MSSLSFEVLGARAEPHAAVPTLALRLRLIEADAQPVHAVALRCQIMIEPQKRRYEPEEQARLVELFGETPRWGETLRPFLWTHVSTVVTGFHAATEVDLPITCTYDFEVAAAKYLHGLDDGEIDPPALLGTIFRAPAAGSMAASPVAWHELHAACRPGLKRRDGPVLPQQRLAAGVPGTLDALPTQGPAGPADVGSLPAGCSRGWGGGRVARRT